MIKGELFTTNGRKNSNDRSYMEHIWRVLEEDESHVWAKAEFGDFWTNSGHGHGRPVAFNKREYDFLPCHEDVLANLIKENEAADAIRYGKITKTA